MITWENYEEYLMMHADGELSMADEKALMVFLEAHPELKDEMAAYERIRVAPDAGIVYEHKVSLLKTEPVKRTASLPQWSRYSIAAGVAAVIFFSVFKYNERGTNKDTIAKTGAIKKQTTALAPAPANTNTTNTAPAAVAIAATNIIKTSKSHSRVPAIAYNSKKEGSIHRRDAIQYGSVQPVRAQVDMLPIAGLKEVPDQIPPTQEEPTDKEIPSMIVTTGEHPDAKKSIWDILPIDKEKKKDLKTVAAAVADTYEQINTIKKGLRETSVTIKVQKRKLIISF